MKKKYIIIGAGAAGLSFAATLKKNGEDSFIILEKEKESGGLCRSVECNGAPIDIGGGHILDVRNKPALDFVFSYMPEHEWNIYDRNTKIVIGENTVGYPLESNIWQFPKGLQLDYLESIAKVQSKSEQEPPEKFMDWIYWKFGDMIAETYMIPYNSKIWSCDLNKLGTYWLYKLPDVSFREVLTSCLNKTPSGQLPAHARFYYPKKHGYGEVFNRIAETLKGHIYYNCAVNNIDCDTRAVNDSFEGEFIVNTAPWHEFAGSLPQEIQEQVSLLEYASIDIDYCSGKSRDSESHWTYFADIGLPYHRIIHRDNIIQGSKGYWTETNAVRRSISEEGHFENQYAYPLNTVGKSQIIGNILHEMGKKNIFGIGRWGEWEHMNSDIAMTRGIEFAKQLLK